MSYNQNAFRFTLKEFLQQQISVIRNKFQK